MKYIVDMQGFKQPGNVFVLKELAIVPFEQDAQPLTFLFEESFRGNDSPISIREKILGWSSSIMVFLGIQAIVPTPTSELFFEHVCMMLLRYLLWAP